MPSADTITNAVDDFCKIMENLQDKGIDFSKFAKELVITLNEQDKLKLFSELWGQATKNTQPFPLTAGTEFVIDKDFKLVIK